MRSFHKHKASAEWLVKMRSIWQRITSLVRLNRALVGYPWWLYM